MTSGTEGALDDAAGKLRVSHYLLYDQERAWDIAFNHGSTYYDSYRRPSAVHVISKARESVFCPHIHRQALRVSP